MRYYDLTISDASGAVYQPSPDGLGFKKSSAQGGVTFASHRTLAGRLQANPGALQLEFDIPAAPANLAQGAAKIVVHGVGLGMIGQASDLNGKNFLLKAGMKPGLPLATAAAPFAGPILQGQIFQAFGNWQGTNQTLELVVNGIATQPDLSPVPSMTWGANQTLASALYQTLIQAFGKLGMKVSVNISQIVQPVDGSHAWANLQQLADYVFQKSVELGAPTYSTADLEYSGVQIKWVGNTIYAYDNQAPPSAPVQLAFTDLIGQPTWIGPATVNFKTVLRSDLALGSYMKFPTKGIVAPYVLTTQAAAYQNTPATDKTRSVFQNQFWITRVQHFGSFRQPQADAWCTSIDAVSVPQQ